MKNTYFAQALKLLLDGTMLSATKIKKSIIKTQNKQQNAFEMVNCPFNLGSVYLKNQIIMSTKKRCRAIGNRPNELMKEYYKQRSGAGLIITEGTSISPNGLGNARIPGIYSKPQIEAWENTTSEVHKSGGKIFVKLMHSGRLSHPLNMPKGSQILSPSAVKAFGKIWTDSKKMQDFPMPKEMSTEDIQNVKTEFINAAINAMQAGFDGVEINAGSGYLLEQFISPISNIRKDNYGGDIKNRCRFVIEVVTAVADAIGKEKIGIRISPYSIAGGMQRYQEIEATYNYLSEQINMIGISYLHLSDHSAVESAIVPLELKKIIRNNFKSTIILSGGYEIEKAKNDINCGLADLVVFGRPFLNNPIQINKLKNTWPLSIDLNINLFYTAVKTVYSEFPACIA